MFDVMFMHQKQNEKARLFRSVESLSLGSEFKRQRSGYELDESRCVTH